MPPTQHFQDFENKVAESSKVANLANCIEKQKSPKLPKFKKHERGKINAEHCALDASNTTFSGFWKTKLQNRQKLQILQILQNAKEPKVAKFKKT